MVGDLGAPGRPVVRDVVAPQVQLVADALLGEHPGEPLRGRAARPVVSSHWPWPQTSSRLSRDAQPLEVVAAEMRDVVDRVVEVGRARRARPSRSRSTGRSCPTCRCASGNRSARLSAKLAAWKAPRLMPVVRISPPVSWWMNGTTCVEDPRLVAAVLARALLERQRLVRPRGGVEGVRRSRASRARPRSGLRRRRSSRCRASRRPCPPSDGKASSGRP